MKKFFLVMLFVFSFVVTSYAFNPNSFVDEEQINVSGNRQKVDIVVSEITVNIVPEDFVDGVFQRTVTVTNQGNVPCNLIVELQNVPVDLNVTATVDDNFLTKNQSTILHINVEETDMQNSDSFSFVIVVKASLH